MSPKTIFVYNLDLEFDEWYQECQEKEQGWFLNH